MTAGSWKKGRAGVQKRERQRTRQRKMNAGNGVKGKSGVQRWQIER